MDPINILPMLAYIAAAAGSVMGTDTTNFIYEYYTYVYICIHYLGLRLTRRLRVHHLLWFTLNSTPKP